MSLALINEMFHKIASAVMSFDFLSLQLVSVATTARLGFITVHDAPDRNSAAGPVLKGSLFVEYGCVPALRTVD